MTRQALLVAAAVTALAGCGGSNDASTPTTGSTAATTTSSQPSAPAPEGKVLAAASDAAGSKIFWVDARTLEPVDDHGVAVPFFTSVGELSPDGDRLAVGESEGGSVLFVDLKTMEPLG